MKLSEFALELLTINEQDAKFLLNETFC